MSQRANLIKCEGLITHGSELSVKEGSLRQATNVNIDEDGVITPRRGFNDYGNATEELTSTSKRVKQLFEYKQRLFRHFEDQIQFEDENGIFRDIEGSFIELRSGYRIKSQESKGNMYFTTEEGVKRISISKQDELSQNSNIKIEQSGVPKAAYMEGSSVNTVGGFLPPQSKVGYRFLFGRKDNSGNLLLGSPSAREVISNTDDKQVTFETIDITIDTDVIQHVAGTDYQKDDIVKFEGLNYICTADTTAAEDPTDDNFWSFYDIKDQDYIVLNTLESSYTFYFKSVQSQDDIEPPYRSDTFGSTFVLVDISTVSSSADRAAVLANAIINNVSQFEVNLSANVVQLTSKEEGNLDSPSFFFENFKDNAPLYQATQPYNIGDKVEFNGLEYECQAATLGLDDGTEDPSGDETDNTYWVYLTQYVVNYPVTVYVTQQGELVQGESAYCSLKLILPLSITQDYFVQVYRTAYITASEGLDLQDIDPGDEGNIVYETNVTLQHILEGEINFNDTRSESFRAQGTPLYTNQITGEGILQSNDPPPIALDIELFRSSMFYANTKSAHTAEFDIVSVDDFRSGTTRIVIGNSSVTRYYTAIQGIDKDSSEESDTPEGGNFYLSDSDSTGQAIDETSRSIVKIINQDSQSPVNVFYLSSPEDLPGQLLFEARDLTDDTFYVAVEEPDFVPSEDSDNFGQEFEPELPVSRAMQRLYSHNVGLETYAAIQLDDHDFTTGDEKFISFLNESTVYSSTEPYFEGNIVFFNDEYHECIDDNAGAGITGIDPTNLTNWQSISYLPDSFSGIYTITEIDDNNFYINYNIPSGIDSQGPNGFIDSNSAIFSPDFESDNLEVPNRVYYSKVSEPEAVPIANYIDVGAKDEEIKRILALRDNLFVLKDDGIYIVSGTSAPNFSVRLLDNTRILAPDSAVVLNNQIYALTEQGITVITDSGAGVISRGIENLIDKVSNSTFDYIPNTFGIPYENDRAYILFMPQEEENESATQAYRYNIFERTWSRWEYSATCGIVSERNNKLYLGDGNRNYVVQERKNFDRTDICDRNFNIPIGSRGIDGTEIDTVTDEVEVGDVITQEQEVSVNYVNRRLLRKMDIFDSGLELSGAISETNPVVFTTSYVDSNTNNTIMYKHLLDDGSSWDFKIVYNNTNNEEVMEVNTYTVTVIDDYNFSIDFDNTNDSIISADLLYFYSKTFSVQTGDFMPEKLQKLHDYLSSRDPIIDSRYYTLLNMRENVEYLVDMLNDGNSITFLKDYKYPENVIFEAYITEVNRRDNFIYSHTERPFLQQPLTVYKHIEKVVEWNPQHFGDPSALKQVRSVSIIFDQNNFYEARAKFASDVSQALSDIKITGKGIAYWGDLDFNDLNAYWGGEGNDVPFRTIVPRDKQRCRYLTIQFEHNNAREEFKVLGVAGVVRAISERGYR